LGSYRPHDPIEGYDKPFSQKKQFIQFKDSPPLTSIKKNSLWSPSLLITALAGVMLSFFLFFANLAGLPSSGFG